MWGITSIARAGPHRFGVRMVDSNLVALGEPWDVLLSLGLIRNSLSHQSLPGLSPPGQPASLLHLLLLLRGSARQSLLRWLQSQLKTPVMGEHMERPLFNWRPFSEKIGVTTMNSEKDIFVFITSRSWSCWKQLSGPVTGEDLGFWFHVFSRQEVVLLLVVPW